MRINPTARVRTAVGAAMAAAVLTVAGIAVGDRCQEPLEPGQETALSGGECLETKPGQRIKLDVGGSGEYGPCQDAPAGSYTAPEGGAYVKDCT